MKYTGLFVASFLLLILASGCLNATTAVTTTRASIITTTTIPRIVKNITLTQKVETDRFILYLPYDWKDVTAARRASGKHYEAYYNAQGSVFPSVYHGSPLYLNIWVEKINSSEDLKSVAEAIVSSYEQNPDRVFPSDFKITPYEVNLSSGQDAYFIHVRYRLNSSSLNQSRYDLITADPQEKIIYAMTFTIQYKPDYATAEKELKLNELAVYIFRTFRLKDYTPETSTTLNPTNATTTIGISTPSISNGIITSIPGTTTAPA